MSLNSSLIQKVSSIINKNQSENVIETLYKNQIYEITNDLKENYLPFKRNKINGKPLGRTIFFLLLFNNLLYLAYCIVYFIEIKMLNRKINLEEIESFDFSILKTSLSISLFLILLFNNKCQISKTLFIIINFSIFQGIRYSLFKSSSNFLSEYIKKSYSHGKNITIVCIVFSLLYLILKIYSNISCNEPKITEEYICVLEIDKFRNNTQNIYMTMKIFYIQFLLFYFLTMRNLNDKFKIFENTKNFKIYFYCSLLFSIIESFELLIIYFIPHYQLFVSKINFFIKFPTIILSLSQFSHYFYLIKKSKEFIFIEYFLMQTYGFILLIICILLIIFDIRVNYLYSLRTENYINTDQKKENSENNTKKKIFSDKKDNTELELIEDNIFNSIQIFKLSLIIQNPFNKNHKLCIIKQFWDFSLLELPLEIFSYIFMDYFEDNLENTPERLISITHGCMDFSEQLPSILKDNFTELKDLKTSSKTLILAGQFNKEELIIIKKINDYINKLQFNLTNDPKSSDSNNQNFLKILEFLDIKKNPDLLSIKWAENTDQ